MPDGFGRPSPAADQPWMVRPRAWSATAGVRAEEGDTDRWAVRAASVVGVRHRLAAVGNDDAFAFTDLDGALRVVVADGVGSVPGSAEASAVAVAAALEPSTAEDAIRAANEAAAELGRGATTIVVGTVEPDGRFALARVGDSSAFLLRDGTWDELFVTAPEGDDGSVAVATRALPADDLAIEHVEGLIGPGAVLLLATDGVADPLRDGPETVAPALATALAVPLSAIALAAVADFSRQGCHDDRTILAVWTRRDEAPGGGPGAS